MLWPPDKKSDIDDVQATILVDTVLNKVKFYYENTDFPSAVFVSLALNAQWLSTAGPVGGYTPALAIRGELALAGNETGIFRSVDGGRTWARIEQPMAQVTMFCFHNDKIFLISEYRELFRSDDQGRTWKPLSTEMPPVAIASIGDRLVLLTVLRAQYSDDDGENWQSASAMEMFVPGSPIAQDNGILYSWDTSPSQFFHSQDSAVTWAKKGSIDGWYDVEEFVVRENVVLAAAEAMSTPEWSGVLKSEDGGISWNRLDNMSMRVNSMVESGDAVVAATEKGLFVTTDLGATWLERGPQASQIYHAVASDGATVLCSSSDGVFVSHNGMASWTKIPEIYSTSTFAMFNSVDRLWAGTPTSVHSTDRQTNGWKLAMPAKSDESDTVVGIISSGNKVYTALRNAGLFVSDNNGGTWNAITTIPPHEWSIVDLKLANGQIYVIESDRIYISGDMGDTWETSNLPGFVSHGVIKDSLILLAKDTRFEKGKAFLFKSIDNGNTWITVSMFPTLADSSSITALITDADGVYLAAVEGYWEPKTRLLYSADYGDTWMDLNLPEYTDLIFTMKAVGNTVFAGTFAGELLYTHNKKDWKLSDRQGLPSKYPSSFYSLETWNDTLYAGVRKAGIWKCALSEFTSTSSINDIFHTEPQVKVVPNPASDHITIEGLPHTDDCKIEIRSVSGKLVSEQKYDAIQQKHLPLALPKGSYTVTVHTSSGITTRKLIVL